MPRGQHTINDVLFGQSVDRTGDLCAVCGVQLPTVRPADMPSRLFDLRLVCEECLGRVRAVRHPWRPKNELDRETRVWLLSRAFADEPVVAGDRSDWAAEGKSQWQAEHSHEVLLREGFEIAKVPRVNEAILNSQVRLAARRVAGIRAPQGFPGDLAADIEAAIQKVLRPRAGRIRVLMVGAREVVLEVPSAKPRS